MSFSTELANLLTNQLSRFVTLNRYQLAGQVANLDFWLGEVRHGLSVLDGYTRRFEQMRDAQNAYVEQHQTVEWPLGDDEFKNKPLAHRTPANELQQARRLLCLATYRFLVRCYNEGFLEEARLAKACEDLAIGVDAKDLKRRG